MGETPDELKKEVREFLDTPVDELLDRQINRPHAITTPHRLAPEKRAELKARVEKDFAQIRAAMEEEAYLLGAEAIHRLIRDIRDGKYGADGLKGSDETDGLAQILNNMEWCLRELHHQCYDG